jgi:hypothetical protein
MATLIPVGFPEALDQQAKALRARLDAHTYTEGEERALAGRAIAVLDADEYTAGLAWLVEDRVQRFLLGDCQLNEVSDATYTLIDQISDQVLAAIQPEDEPLIDTLQRWAAGYVDDYADLLRYAA